MNLVIPLPALPLPGSWNLVAHPQEKCWAHSGQGWPPGDATALSQCDTHFLPRGINHRGAPLYPLLSQELWGSHKLFFKNSTKWYTSSMRVERTDPTSSMAVGVQRECHGDADFWGAVTLSRPLPPATLTPPTHTHGPEEHLILFLFSLFEDRNPKIKSPHPLTLSFTPSRCFLEIVQSFCNGGKKNPSSWPQSDLGWEWW